MAAEAAAGWQAAYAELKRQDERMCQEYKEDIDTVLIFVCSCVIDIRAPDRTRHRQVYSRLSCPACSRSRIPFCNRTTRRSPLTHY
jgi:hypothetical protein